MVAAAHPGDRMRVEGACTSNGVVIDKDLVIRGIGPGAALRPRVGSARRVLGVARGASVVLRDLIVEGGRLVCGWDCSARGAGIRNHGRLTLRRVVVQGNGGTGDIAGLGIWNGGTLILRGSVVRRNRGSEDFGAAGILNQGTLLLRHSRVVDNDQGGILNGEHGQATLVDSAVVRNRRGYYSSGIHNIGHMSVIGSTIRDNTGGDGELAGGIVNDGTLTVRDAVIRDNRGPGGGGIWTGGILTIVDSVIRDNGSVDGSGGGILNFGILTVRASVIRDNRALGGAVGGGLANAGDAVVRGSRIVGNRSGSRGGGIFNNRNLSLVDTVVRHNRASEIGGGIYNEDFLGTPGTVEIDAGSSVSRNSPDDCVGTTAC
jgi:hypothetical protein